METIDAATLVRKFYEAYAAGDRSFVENHITDDFTFSAPPDPHLDRNGYFERCWPGAGQGQNFDIQRIIVHENTVVVTYETTHNDTTKGCNTEIFTLKGGKVQRVEVYFGWDTSAS